MREYEYVSAIAREGTLSGAAVQLGISQPALTRFLQKEEGELGTALFQRIDNRMVLTYAGECYLEHIKQIFAIQAHMRAALDDITRMDRGRLRERLLDTVDHSGEVQVDRFLQAMEEQGG